MILLKISNSSEVVAAKVGQFVEKLTPDSLDHLAVEDQVIKKLIESLIEEGIKGEVTSINGIDIDDDKLVVNEGLKIRSSKRF